MLGLFFALTLTQIAAAQFGKQLIDYEKHNWKYLETEHFRLFFYKDWVEAMLPQLVSWTETAYSQLTAELDYHPLAPKWQKTQLPITINGKTVKIDYWYPLPLKPKGFFSTLVNLIFGELKLLSIRQLALALLLNNFIGESLCRLFKIQR